MCNVCVAFVLVYQFIFRYLQDLPFSEEYKHWIRTNRTLLTLKFRMVSSMEMMTKSFRLRVNIYLRSDFNYQPWHKKFDKNNMLIKFHFSVIVLGSGNGRAVLVLRKRLDYDSGERNFNLTIKAQVIINYVKGYL